MASSQIRDWLKTPCPLLHQQVDYEPLDNHAGQSLHSFLNHLPWNIECHPPNHWTIKTEMKENMLVKESLISSVLLALGPQRPLSLTHTHTHTHTHKNRGGLIVQKKPAFVFIHPTCCGCCATIASQRSWSNMEFNVFSTSLQEAARVPDCEN